MDISIVPSKQSSTKAGKWQAYVDDALLLTGQVTKAGIYGLDGLQWAASSDLKVTPAQVSKLLASLIGDDSALKREGIKVANHSYIFLRKNQERSLYGRKGPSSGVCVVKTNKTILVGIYDSGIQAGNCNSVMEKLADYLIQHNL